MILSVLALLFSADKLPAQQMQAEKAAQNLLNECPVIFPILEVNYYFT